MHQMNQHKGGHEGGNEGRLFLEPKLNHNTLEVESYCDNVRHEQTDNASFSKKTIQCKISIADEPEALPMRTLIEDDWANALPMRTP